MAPHAARTAFTLLLLTGLALALPVEAQTTISTGTTRYDANTANGSWLLANGSSLSIASGANEALRIANTGTSGTYTLTINGTVSQNEPTAGSGGRGIRTGNAGTGVNVSITIGSTGFISSKTDDAIQGRNVGTFNLTNLGTLYSGTAFGSTPSAAIVTGRGLNLRDVTAGGTVINGSSSDTTHTIGVIRADGGDAVRVGSGFTFTNYGQINAAGVVNDVSSNNVFNTTPLSTSVATTYSAGAGFSFEDIDATHGAINSSLDNHGTITGARHGVQAGTAGTNLTVTNREGASIIGRNGSGVGFDTTETDASKIVVNNHGLIRGDYAGAGQIVDRTGNASPTNDGDGDGVDIDGAATIRNYSTGEIKSTGAGGYDSSGRANNSEAISIGGGVIENDGLIQGADRGIVVNNDSIASRSGVAATTITNNATGTIEGLNGYAIRLENKLGTAADNDTIDNAGTIIGGGTIPDPTAIVMLQGNGGVDTNSVGTLDGVVYTGTGNARFVRGDGSAIQMGEGADVLTNTGTITGNTGRAVNMEGGDDTVNFNGGTITGSINGGAGTDRLALGDGISHGGAIMNFEQFKVSTGTATLNGVLTGTTFNKEGAGKLILTAANTLTGTVMIEAGSLIVNNTTGSGTGLGDVIVNSGALLGGTGTIAGSVTADGLIGPGNSLGTLTIEGDLTWNGSIGNAWQFELGAGSLADLLWVEGDFLKGTGDDFYFDFGGAAFTGTFVLVDWANSTTFSAEDFAYMNLGGGLAGSFDFNGSQLEFTVAAIPEPATNAAIIGGIAAALVLWRRRQTRVQPVHS